METIVRLPNQLGAAVKRARRKKGYTQKDLGELTGLRQATISQLESGEVGAQLGTVLRVLAALDLELVIRTRNAHDWLSELPR